MDNRPSSPAIAAACIAAAQAMDVQVDFYGVIPTPALAFQAMQDGIPAIMVTGSHIPFDRNGLKFYRADGEITKADEVAILSSMAEVPALPMITLPAVSNRAAQSYQQRYLSIYPAGCLAGLRIGLYEPQAQGVISTRRYLAA
jgi:phosphomannomutase